ncbi:DUF2231 domain-containing protein [Steroidobacter cummioxidans]|uniref:DUF2231 domain-containing protein n=1 Tax=Steroidobacter cummioxidans TaxID=1803913 RepID=UPI0039C94F5A
MSRRPDPRGPPVETVAKQDVSSAIAVAGHPLHAMSVHFPIALVFATLGIDVLYWFQGDPFFLRAGIWSSGFAFGLGVLAALVGTAELLAVKGIRSRVSSWSHGVAAMMLLSIAGANWGLRLTAPEEVLPHGLALSVLAAIFTGLAGWHGGKLVFDHGVGLMIDDRK